MKHNVKLVLCTFVPLFHGNSPTHIADHPGRPRLVRDSDLELKKAERRGGSSWVTAGIPRSLPAAGERRGGGWWPGGDRAQKVAAAAVGCSGMREAACHPGRSTFLQGVWRTTKTAGRLPRQTSFPGFICSCFLFRHENGWRPMVEPPSKQLQKLRGKTQRFEIPRYYTRQERTFRSGDNIYWQWVGKARDVFSSVNKPLLCAPLTYEGAPHPPWQRFTTKVLENQQKWWNLSVCIRSTNRTVLTSFRAHYWLISNCINNYLPPAPDTSLPLQCCCRARGRSGGGKWPRGHATYSHQSHDQNVKERKTYGERFFSTPRKRLGTIIDGSLCNLNSFFFFCFASFGATATKQRRKSSWLLLLHLRLRLHRLSLVSRAEDIIFQKAAEALRFRKTATHFLSFFLLQELCPRQMCGYISAVRSYPLGRCKPPVQTNKNVSMLG